MKLSMVLIFVVAMVMEALALTDGHVTTRDIKGYPGQQPLLFGRRGLNPNMNSLFFGKRSSSPSVFPTARDVKSACTYLMNYLDEVERLVEE